MVNFRHAEDEPSRSYTSRLFDQVSLSHGENFTLKINIEGAIVLKIGRGQTVSQTRDDAARDRPGLGRASRSRSFGRCEQRFFEVCLVYVYAVSSSGVEPDLSGAPGAPATIPATPYSTWQSDFSEGKYSGPLTVHSRRSAADASETRKYGQHCSPTGREGFATSNPDSKAVTGGSRHPLRNALPRTFPLERTQRSS